MNLKTTSLTAATFALLLGASANSAVVINGTGQSFSQISDAMNWITTSGGGSTYTVHADNGSYGSFDQADNSNLTWGNSPGVIDIGGNMRVRSAAQMLFEIAGTSNVNAFGTGVVDYDTVLVTGNVSYEGTINVNLLSGFMPTLGNSFELIASSGSVAYTGTLNAPTLSAGLAWQVSVGSSTFSGAGYGGQSLFLNVVPAPGAVALIGLAGVVASRRRRN
jgi:hypothetical protein